MDQEATELLIGKREIDPDVAAARERSSLNLVAAFLALLLVSSCAGNRHTQGQKLLQQEDYAGAVAALQTALAAAPGNVAILGDLAEAHYHLEQLDDAQRRLQQARALDPRSSDLILLAGLIHEKRGDRRAAIAAYREYTGVSRLSRNRKIIEARLAWLIRQQIAEETKAAVAREGLLDVADIPDNAVAVAPFRNLGANRVLDPLQKGLAEMMITDLSKVRRLQVVERVRMQEMMREIGLAQTGAVDPSTAPRLGKLVGANRVVNGSFTDLSAEQLRLDASIAGVKTEEVDASEARGPLAQLFRLQKELIFSLIGEMGIALSEEERLAIQEIPTESLLAFIAYSKGLDHEDQGRTREAESEFQKAAQLDPKFKAARKGMDRVQGMKLGATRRRTLEKEVLPARRLPPPPPPGAPPKKVLARKFSRGLTPEMLLRKTPGRLDRLAATGMRAGAGFIPAARGGQKDVRRPIPEQLRELEKITFRKDEAVLDILVPVKR